MVKALQKKKFTRIFFATDIHGSEKVFLKFIGAAKFYGVDVLILGGDITGKMVVPVREQADGTFKCEFMDQKWHVKKEEVEKLEEKIKFVGFYPYRTTEGGAKKLYSSPKEYEKVYKRLATDRLKRWIEIVQERLKDTDIKVYIAGGNDDPPYIADLLTSSNLNPEERVIYIDENHEMVSLAYSNITPWKTPRECSEEKLAKKIEDLLTKVENMENCIFNFHVPPINSTIDTAPKVDATTMPPKYVVERGVPVMIGAGSVAVREAIEKHQPLLGLHGHIHESRGAIKIGRTLCVNPGSEYSEGILRGVIISFDEKGIKGYQFTSG